MPSKLRLELDFTVLPPVPSKLSYSTLTSTPTRRPAISSPLADNRKNKMSLTQTYRIASCARNKLGKEAMKPDHDLRLLVGHANLLDSLMLDLANAERQQEAWFNSTLRRASAAKRVAPPKHIQWMDTVAEGEEAVVADDSDSEYETMSEDGELSEDDDEDLLLDADNFPTVNLATRQRRVKSPPPPPPATEDSYAVDEDMEIFDDEADEEHALVRVPSNATSISSSSSSPSTPEVPEALPALEYELESDEDSPLPSPAKENFVFFPASKKARTDQMSAATDLVRAHLAQPAVVVS